MPLTPEEAQLLGEWAKVHTTAQNKISSAAASWGKRRDRKFATQMIKNDNKLGIGVWRIE